MTEDFHWGIWDFIWKASPKTSPNQRSNSFSTPSHSFFWFVGMPQKKHKRCSWICFFLWFFYGFYHWIHHHLGDYFWNQVFFHSLKCFVSLHFKPETDGKCCRKASPGSFDSEGRFFRSGDHFWGHQGKGRLEEISCPRNLVNGLQPIYILYIGL